MMKNLNLLKKTIQIQNNEKNYIFSYHFWFISTELFSKKELKTIDKHIKAQEYESALNKINSIKTLVDAADDKTKAKYYYLKGMARYQNGNGSFDNKILSIIDFNEAKKLRNQDQKYIQQKLIIFLLIFLILLLMILEQHLKLKITKILI